MFFDESMVVDTSVLGGYERKITDRDDARYKQYCVAPITANGSRVRGFRSHSTNHDFVNCRLWTRWFSGPDVFLKVVRIVESH